MHCFERIVAEYREIVSMVGLSRGWGVFWACPVSVLISLGDCYEDEKYNE